MIKHLGSSTTYQVKCLKFKVPARLASESVAGRPKVPKVKGTKMTITCFGPVFIGLKMGFPILEIIALYFPGCRPEIANVKVME